MPSIPDLIYLGRGRLHKPRANVVQSMHMLKAWASLGLNVQAWFPPYRSSAQPHLPRHDNLSIRSSQWLHPRWGFKPFVWRYHRQLAAGGAIFTRDARIALALAQREIPNTLELHEFRLMQRDGLTEPILAAHHAHIIQHIVTTTSIDTQRLIEHGSDPARTHSASNGVDWDAYTHIAPFDPDRLDHPRLVYIGRISRTRGLGVIEALADRLDTSATVIGELADPLRSDRVKHLPFIPADQVPDWYGQCDIALLPYQADLAHAESISPIKLFEAMAAGRPIVVSRLPTIEQIVEHEQTALLVEPGDLDAWEHAVRRLQDNRELAQRLAKNARAHAQQYSWQNRARRIGQWMGLAGVV